MSGDGNNGHLNPLNTIDPTDPLNLNPMNNGANTNGGVINPPSTHNPTPVGGTNNPPSIHNAAPGGGQNNPPDPTNVTPQTVLPPGAAGNTLNTTTGTAAAGTSGTGSTGAGNTGAVNTGAATSDAAATAALVARMNQLTSVVNDLLKIVGVNASQAPNITGYPTTPILNVNNPILPAQAGTTVLVAQDPIPQPQPSSSNPHLPDATQNAAIAAHGATPQGITASLLGHTYGQGQAPPGPIVGYSPRVASNAQGGYASQNANTQGLNPSTRQQATVRHTAGASSTYDSSDSEYYGTAHVNSQPQRHKKQGSSRRKHETNTASRSRRAKPLYEDEPPIYAINRETPEITLKNLTIKAYSMTNKTQEWSIWVKQFEKAIMRGKNPHSSGNHEHYCLQWLPSSLETNAYTIWERCIHRESDWTKLKSELDDAFEDPQEKATWKTNLQAYQWKEGTESLQTYCTNVKQKVDKHEPELAGHTTALRSQYFLRFVSGLPEDYKDQVQLAVSAKRADVEKAMDICTRFKSVKDKGNKTETVAAVTFNDGSNALGDRIRKNEVDIARISTKMKQIDTRDSTPPQDDAQIGPPGRSPYYPSNRYSRPRPNFNQDHQSRQAERLNRFRGNRPGDFRRRSGSGNRGQDQPRQALPADGRSTETRPAYSKPYDNRPGSGSVQGQQSGPNTHSHSRRQESQSQGRNEGLALETEVESAAELDDTMAQYAAFQEAAEEEQFLQFCNKKDSGTGN